LAGESGARGKAEKSKKSEQIAQNIKDESGIGRVIPGATGRESKKT